MITFRYQAVGESGGEESGVIEARDRRDAIAMLSERGLYPSRLEVKAGGTPEVRDSAVTGAKSANSANGLKTPMSRDAKPAATSGVADRSAPRHGSRTGQWGDRVRRKEVTSFTREMAALVEADIPILQALTGLGEEEENPAFQRVLRSIADSVRTGVSLSAALEEHPRLFTPLYASMIRVGEEAGALDQVMTDLASLMEHEDELRGEVMAAVSYPLFVLGFGVFTVIVLLSVVLPRLFGMLQEMLDILPLPTVILLNVSEFIKGYWPLLLVLVGAAVGAFRWYKATPAGALRWDGIKLKLPFMGRVFMASALSRFARTLGTLVKSGVTLLPALKIVENTIGNRVLARMIARVSEETRGGESLGGPLKRLGVFPSTMVQMITVGEETGQLDRMLLKVADIEERHMRAVTKTLISLLAPALILVVGALVGFMVIALLLPIFRMSQSLR